MRAPGLTPRACWTWTSSYSPRVCPLYQLTEINACPANRFADPPMHAGRGSCCPTAQVGYLPTIQRPLALPAAEMRRREDSSGMYVWVANRVAVWDAITVCFVRTVRALSSR
jgi:hypothetical protein